MTTIPDDIMRAARGAYLTPCAIGGTDADFVQSIARAILAERERAAGEVSDLKLEVIAFCAPHAALYARQGGLPDGHLDSVHYDILEKCGARMDAFTRHDPAAIRERTNP
jgi:hypothetical protein